MEQPKLNEQRPYRTVRLILWTVALVAAGIIFIFRGPMRGPDNSPDFGIIYTSARCWVHGSNPYRSADLQQEVDEPATEMDIRWPSGALMSMYPPSTYVVFSPLGLLAWPHARTAWLLLNVIMLVCMVMGVIRYTPVHQRADWILAFIALTLIWAPIHTGFYVGQLGLAASALGGIGVLMIGKGRGIVGGILLGLGIAVKPQLVGLLLVIPLIRRQYHDLGIAIAVAGGITLIGLVQLQATSPTWFTDLRENLYTFFHSNFGDPTRDNSSRYQLINLQYPLHTLLDSRMVVKVIVGVFATGQTLLLIAAGWKRHHSDLLLLIGALIAILLSSTYHRSYDAAGLLFAAAWVLTAKNYTLPLRIGCAVCLAAFLSPGGALLMQLDRMGWIPPALAEGWCWRVLFVPHQAWLLFSLSLLLTYAYVFRPCGGQSRSAIASPPH